MDIEKLISKTKNPGLYEKGNAVMWTDPHISKQLLQVHLNKDIDLASRKYSTIESTVEWILDHANKKENMNILDLGCGPGLYAELLAEKGHKVTGVDFSRNSIEYAKGEAAKKKLNIEYLNKNYLKLDLPENHFDLVILIYTDFGPLLPDERNNLLDMIHKVLKPGGVFIFDVLSDTNMESKAYQRSWEMNESGFWSDKPYLALSDSILYKEEKLILYQHIVFQEDEDYKIYRFWNHFFSDEDIRNITAGKGYVDIEFFHDVLPSGQGYEGKDVTICKSVKS